MREIYSQQFNSPVGLLTLTCHSQALTGISWADLSPVIANAPANDQDLPLVIANEVNQSRRRLDCRVAVAPRNDDTVQGIVSQTQKQLLEYFSGKRRSFDIPLEFEGTEFQKRVWQALLEIPYGETRSYADIAQAVGSPKAAIAVGLANSKNPISIIAPCHRVIGSNGKLKGYAGGLENKKYLLRLENAELD